MANTAKQRRVVPVRIILLVVLLVIIAAVAAGFLFWGLPHGGTETVALPSMGNDGGNLANGGMVLEIDGNVYLTDAGGQIVQVTAGQASGTAVGDLKGDYLNSDGASLWYVDRDTGALMKSDLDGSNPTAVVSGRVTRPMLVDDYVYFIDADSNYALSRVSTADGSAVELLSAARVLQYTVVGEKIFYRDLNATDTGSFMNLDGSDAMDVGIRVGQVIFSHGGRLYHSNPDRDGAIDYYELGSNGSYYGPTALDTGTVTCAVADDEAIYYTRAQDGHLCRLRLNGGSEEELTEYPVYGLQSVEEYIYYWDVTNAGMCGAIAKN